MTLQQIFAENLAAEMARQGLNTVSLHRKSGVTQSHISAIAGGRKGCTLETVSKLSKALNVPAHFMLVERMGVAA